MVLSQALRRGIHLPTCAILFTTFLWGTWWIPLRKLDSLGDGTIWFTGVGALLPALLFIPLMLRRRRRLLAGGLPLLICALSFGVACAFYAEGAMRGNVARVILLFYMTPIWSTLLARLLLSEPITRRRLASIVVGLSGMWIVLGGDGAIPLPRDVAEWMGLIAGFAWALAMVYTQINSKLATLEIAGPVFFAFAIVFISTTLIPGGRDWSTTSLSLWPAAVAWILALAMIWHLPSIILTLFGGASVEPGRVAILLMLEVIIGVGSAAMLANEPFGLREGIGAVLVIAAGLCEFMPSSQKFKDS